MSPPPTLWSPSRFLSALLSQHLFSPFHFPPRRCLLSSPSSSYPFPRQRLSSLLLLPRSPGAFYAAVIVIAVIRGTEEGGREKGAREGRPTATDDNFLLPPAQQTSSASLPSFVPPRSPAYPRLEVAWKVSQTKKYWPCLVRPLWSCGARNAADRSLALRCHFVLLRPFSSLTVDKLNRLPLTPSSRSSSGSCPSDFAVPPSNVGHRCRHQHLRPSSAVVKMG